LLTALRLSGSDLLCEAACSALCEAFRLQSMYVCAPSQVKDATRKSRVGGQPVFGRARLHIAAAKDGSTLMWCLGKHKKPLAQR